jgi:hypothetical protein|uniref:Uncharacterized protein n=2 Tax=Oryza TaxID=4527 RepID=A0A0E0GC83_ORYNI
MMSGIRQSTHAPDGRAPHCLHEAGRGGDEDRHAPGRVSVEAGEERGVKEVQTLDNAVPEHLLLLVEDMDDVKRLDDAEQDLLLRIEDGVVAAATAGDEARVDDLEERTAGPGEQGAIWSHQAIFQRKWN